MPNFLSNFRFAHFRISAAMEALAGDLDYSLNFPGIEASTKWRIEPVVILFGWGGCQDRFLAKYSKVYERLG